MSKYTTEVRFICESLTGHDDSTGFDDIDSIIEDAIPLIFSFDFPIFDEEYRNVICTKILRHYYTREIGLETYGLWKLKLQTKLNEIMPYYNELYKSALLEFNPFFTVDLTKDYTKTNDGTIKDNGTESEKQNRTTAGERSTDTEICGEDTNGNTRWDIYSDTPQGALTNVNNESYLTNARKITDSGSTEYGKTISEDEGHTISENMNGNRTKTNNQKLDNLETYLEHLKGKTPGVSYSKLLSEYRDTILNVDLQVINELRDLFFNLW